MDCTENITRALAVVSYSDEHSPIIAEQVLQKSLADPERICPILSGAAQIKGKTLTMCLAEETVRLTAPTRYLSRLFSWCQGRMTLGDIIRKSEAECADSRFPEFVQAMLDAGVLVDSAQALLHHVKAARFLGRSAEEKIWRHIKMPTGRLAIPRHPSYSFENSSKSPLLEILAHRRSAEGFSKAGVSENQLTRLLAATYGVQSTDGHRAVASAGGAYSINLHLVLLEMVGNVTPGLYALSFDPSGGIHLDRKDARLEDVPRLLYAPTQLNNATGLLIFSVNPSYSALKYRDKAYSFALLEAGAITQNAALIAAEQNFGWRNIGGVEEKAVSRFLELAPNDHFLIAGMFGSNPEPNTGGESPAIPTDKKISIEFAWASADLHLPFHMAMARVHDGKGQPPYFCWGRDRIATVAHDKAIAEAAERYVFNHLNENLCRLAKFGDMDGMVSPELLTGYGKNQYKSLNFPFQEFDPDRSYLWVEGRNLESSESRWLPAECCYANGALPKSYAERPLTYASTSGCASGPSVEFAQRNALFEILERDSFMRHWFSQRPGSGISVKTLPANLQERLSGLLRAGCHVSIQLLGLGQQPTWMCMIQNLDIHFTVVGSSAGTDPGSTLESAISEAETAAYTHLQNRKPVQVTPKKVFHAHDHANLYATRRYYQRADALFKHEHELSFQEASEIFPSNTNEVIEQLSAKALEAIWVDMPLPEPVTTFAGDPIHSGRLLIPGLIPITFGKNRLPLAMDEYRIKSSKFPHPFP